MKVDTDVFAQIWVGDDDMEDCTMHVERTDDREVNVMVKLGSEDPIHLYLEPDRAVALAQALVFEASKEWRVP